MLGVWKLKTSVFWIIVGLIVTIKENLLEMLRRFPKAIFRIKSIDTISLGNRLYHLVHQNLLFSPLKTEKIETMK